MKRKNFMALSLLSTSLFLTACGNDDDKYSREEVDQIVNNAVAEALKQSSLQEAVDLDIETDLIMDTQGMDTFEDVPVRGSFNSYEISKENFLNEETFTENERGEKNYTLYSPINHDNLLFNVTSLEVVKYLESDLTSNVFRADEDSSYITMHIMGQNIGDREKEIGPSTFTPTLWIYDENDQLVGKNIDRYGTEGLVNGYLEHYGKKLGFMKVERLGYFESTLGFTVPDELLKPGMKLVLNQNRTVGTRSAYDAAVYQIGNDFELPVTVSQ